MTTPAKPRQSGIPGLGRTGSGIPTPGRSRSSSSVYQTNPSPPDDISRAFADAIKANDPSQHRIPPSFSSSTASLSPHSVSNSLSSGRRSVAGRPSSSASTSSIKIQERAKTPTSARISSRPASRQSDVFNKLPRTFEVGDNVRIESLGFEGTLRYVGEIEGKPGLWAGVELSGGFAGKGKNDGAVGGTQYFSCPEKCGVFVATTKLSPPTVGPGVQRPSSVASSSGRMTPANNGRATPSFFSTSRTPSASYSNGRITPSTGSRVTPSLTNGRITPSSSATARVPRPFKTPTSKTNAAPLSEKFSEGSRASKYMTMTAKQLSSRDRDDGVDSPTRKLADKIGVAPSPTMSRTLSSPTRLSGSPFTTPKALGARPSLMGSSPSLPSTRIRPSMNTPRARVPSNVAMPPPPSPRTFQIQTSTSQNGTASPSPSHDSHSRGAASATAPSSSRPSSSASYRSAGADEVSLIDQLQSRLEAAEYENERLRIATEAQSVASAPDQQEQLDQLRSEGQESIDKASLLETQLSDIESRLKSQTDRIETLESENRTLSTQLQSARSEAEQLTSTQQSVLETHELKVKSLERKVSELDVANREKAQLHQANISTIESLQSHLDKSAVDMQEERKELMAQIDELRIAGQETIALYEERLSVASSQRYELENRISSLESNIKAMVDVDRQKESSLHPVSSATQIDNETLREQVQHLQKKSSKLEEQLEETRATLERDVNSYQDKISRIRLEDEQRKRDLTFKTREMEQLIKSEGLARNRVEEIEEALRESTVALENARGEVELLRGELVNLDILIDDASEGDISSKLANFTKRAAADKARYKQEIERLEQLVSDVRAENALLLENSSAPSQGLNGAQPSLDSLNAENKDLREQLAQLEDRVVDLTQTLYDRTNELDAARKKANRDVPVSSAPSELARSNSSKGDPVREEVAGLKHIVQELQKENLATTQQIKLLQSENELLSTEAEQLRQEVRILEDDLDSSIREANSSSGLISPSKVDKRPTQNTELQNIRSEMELDQMRKRLGEMEVKHGRAVHGLNKEISELEALVESKIYREDELEQEVERLKEKLARRDKKTSKNGLNDATDARHRLSSASSITVSSENGRGAEVCEICERPGHDIFNCSLLKDEVVCEDCESPGHVAANCPHSQDVF